MTVKNSALGKINQRRVLREIWLNEGISRIEIADSLQLDKSTITNIVSELLVKNLIVEVEEGAAGPNGGRKPIKLKIRKNYCVVLGLEVQPEYCNVACVNLAGDIILYKRVDADITVHNFPEIFAEILSDIEKKLTELNIPLAGIGLGLSGMVNPEAGLLYGSIPLEAENKVNIVEKLSEITDVPVIVENDANCCCWGEKVFNKTEDLQDFIFTLVEFRGKHSTKPNYGGIAVGFGIVIDGKVHYGKRFTAGEFKSVFVEQEKTGQFSFGKEKEFLVQKDAALFRDFSVELSRNIALMVNTFALSECFIGGDLEAYREEFSSILKKELDKNWNYPGESMCSIRYSSLNEKAVAYGAAAMIIEKLFDKNENSIRNLMLEV